MNTVWAVSESLRGTLYMRTDRTDDDFIRDTISAIQDYRMSKGVGYASHDRAYWAAYYILKRLKSKGWQFSPPLLPMVGGVLQGSRRKD